MSAHPNPRAETAVEVAAAWFARRRTGAMSAGEAEEMALWLARDPTHAAIFEEMEAIWRAAREIRDDPQMMALRDEELRALRARKSRRTGMIGALAAGVALAAAGSWAAMRGDLPWLISPRAQEFHTAIGQIATATLADGTIVTLNTDTVLHVTETNAKRLVTLEKGQAFFRVAKDASRPFIVTAGGKTVTALGTAFDVRVEPRRLEVTLVEGRVTVAEPRGGLWRGQSTHLAPGWRLVAREDREWSVSPVDTATEMGWVNGRLTFDDTPLALVVDEINRYSRRKVVITDTAIVGTPVIGGFKAGDVDDFVRVVESYGIARVVAQNENTIELGAPKEGGGQK